jgi:hypothetical protein
MNKADSPEPETEQLERYAGEDTTEGTVEEMLANLTNGTSSYENPASTHHDSQTIIVRVSRQLTRTRMKNHRTTATY